MSLMPDVKIIRATSFGGRKRHNLSTPMGLCNFHGVSSSFECVASFFCMCLLLSFLNVLFY